MRLIMQSGDPLELQASPDDALSLQQSTVHFGLATTDRDRCFILGVWVWTAVGTLILTPASVCVFGELEICTLAIDTPEALLGRLRAEDSAQHRELSNPYLRIPNEELPSDLPPPENAVPWPFPHSDVSVLRRMNWVEPVQTMVFEPIQPGTAPKNARVACLSAPGILFQGPTPTERLLIYAYEPPALRLLVTRDAETIDRYIEGCVHVPLARYVEDYLQAPELLNSEGSL